MFCLHLNSTNVRSCLHHTRPSKSFNRCLLQRLKQLQLLEADRVYKALNLISLSTISEWITTRLTRHGQYALLLSLNKLTYLLFPFFVYIITSPPLSLHLLSHCLPVSH